MTPEQKLDRLERIVKLFVKAGLRARRNMRQLDEKLTILVDAQIANEERFAAVVESNEKRFAALAESNETRFAALAESNETRFAALAESNETRFAAWAESNETRFAAWAESNEKRFATLAESQIQTDRRLNALIDIVQQRNGR